MTFKPLIFIQVRSDSSRLPDKWNRELTSGHGLLEVLLLRIERAGYLEETVVLTSDREEDDEIEAFAGGLKGVAVFRGATQDVGLRFLEASKSRRPSHIIRLTGDNPFVPGELLSLLFGGNFSGYDYVSTKIGNGYPVGTDVEFFSSASFQAIRRQELTPYDREHVTPPYYLPRLHPKCLIAPLSRPRDNLSQVRLTVDTQQDLDRLKIATHDMSLEDLFGPWERLAHRVKNLGDA